MEPRRKVQVVILGGGFAGIYAALQLCRDRASEADLGITLIDERNHFTFTPLLPELIAGSLDRNVVVYPIRLLAKQHSFHFIQTRVRDFIPLEHAVLTESGRYTYDYLIVALGNLPDFFGRQEFRQHGFVLNSVDDALSIRNHVILQFEKAATRQAGEDRTQLLTFVVAGGGPAGVEVGSEIQHLIQGTLLSYYPIPAEEPRVFIIQAGGQLLPGMPASLAKEAAQRLGDRGVSVLLNTKVAGVSASGIRLDNGQDLGAGSLIWTVGMRANPILEMFPAAKDRNGRIVVDDYLGVPEFPEVYVIGDNASCFNRRKGETYPPLAPVAIAQGLRAAGNILNDLAGRRREGFEYFPQGAIVSLGAKDALVDLLGLHLTGRKAWWVYRTAYLFKLVGLRNKVLLLLSWVLDWFFPRDISCTAPGAERL